MVNKHGDKDSIALHEVYSLYQSKWYRDNEVITNICNSYMVLIPEGELYFIKTVLFFIKNIKNEKLKINLLKLIRQEQNHSTRDWR